MKVKSKISKSNIYSIGALPINFTGSFLGFNFGIINQFDIYNNVEAEFYNITDAKNHYKIFSLDGSKKQLDNGISILYANAIGTGSEPYKNMDKDIKNFLSQINNEVILHNKGLKSNKKIEIPKQKTPKQKNTNKVKSIKTNSPDNLMKGKKSTVITKVEKWISGTKKCNHIICGVCGGIKNKIGATITDVCSPKCVNASKDSCECKCAGKYHRGNNIEKLNKLISGFNEDFFDVSVINDVDDLRKQYYQLAKKYHPDMGGTVEQMQQVNNQHDILLKKLLSGSKLSEEQQKNEIEIDDTIKKIIDMIISIEGIEIELIGKWLWVGSALNIDKGYSFTTPIYNALKSSGLTYIKKGSRPYMVYKGVETSSRGTMTKSDIEKKYGVHKFNSKSKGKLKGIGKINKLNLKKLKFYLKKLTSKINKRPIN